MTLPVARDLGAVGVRVMTIAPGIMDTPLLARAPQELRDSLAALQVFPTRLGTPEGFAHLVRAIVENPPRDGEVIRIDAGARMTPRQPLLASGCLVDCPRPKPPLLVAQLLGRHYPWRTVPWAVSGGAITARPAWPGLYRPGLWRKRKEIHSEKRSLALALARALRGIRVDRRRLPTRGGHDDYRTRRRRDDSALRRGDDDRADD